MAWPSKRVYGMELLGGRVYFLYDTAELSLCEEDLRWGTATWGGICAGIAAGLWLSWFVYLATQGIIQARAPPARWEGCVRLSVCREGQRVPCGLCTVLSRCSACRLCWAYPAVRFGATAALNRLTADSLVFACRRYGPTECQCPSAISALRDAVLICGPVRAPLGR
jgi:hypothetical protein